MHHVMYKTFTFFLEESSFNDPNGTPLPALITSFIRLWVFHKRSAPSVKQSGKIWNLPVPPPAFTGIFKLNL